MKFNRDHVPSPEEAVAAELIMTDEHKKQSAELENAYQRLSAPRFDEKSGSILFNLDRRLVQTDKLNLLLKKKGLSLKKNFM